MLRVTKMKPVSRLDKEDQATHAKRTREFIHRRAFFFRINVLNVYNGKNTAKMSDKNPMQWFT